MLLSGLLSPFRDTAQVASVHSTAQTVPLFMPYGYSCLPPDASSGALLLPLDGSSACAGFLCDSSGLLPGEIRLRSSGGAEILLLQTGEIRLNGLTITADGDIIPKGGA